MNSRNLATAAAALALGLATLITPGKIQGQGPMYDRVDVSLPYTVTIGNMTLQPGQYVIKQMDSPTDNRVLLIYGDNGMKFETTAMTIPALDINTARKTEVMLHHFGNDYYFDKIWIQGKDYGYEFPLPSTLKERLKEQMQPVSVAATYSSSNENTNTAATAPTTVPPATTQPETTAQAAPPATTQPETTAQAAPPPATVAPQTQTAAAAPYSSEANREAPAMPHTSAGWLMMLLSGGALSSAGMALRRRR
jgi:hypothetical protein